MMIIPKCCDTSSSKMRNNVELYYKKLNTNTQEGIQKNVYTPSLVLRKKCHIKDRSLTAQESAAANSIQNADTAKEFIFKYFNVSGLTFNEIVWGVSRFKVLSISYLSKVTLDGTTYYGSDSKPFVSILAGLQKL